MRKTTSKIPKSKKREFGIGNNAIPYFVISQHKGKKIPITIHVTPQYDFQQCALHLMDVLT